MCGRWASWTVKIAKNPMCCEKMLESVSKAQKHGAICKNEDGLQESARTETWLGKVAVAVLIVGSGRDMTCKRK